MTTKVVVSANHGWPVKVTPVSVKGATVGAETIVAADTEGTFHVHSGQDLLVHEIQPDETDPAPADSPTN